MSPFSRREFLERSAVMSATVAALGAGRSARAAEEKTSAKGSANDRLRVAVVGVNGRGMAHVGGFLGKNNCDIVAVCDCDSAVVGKAMKTISEKQPEAPKYVQDFRRLLDDKSIDVISIATPNHWHALMAVWAMRAGKDVYCEKPATHNVREGRLMTEAAAKYDRICQVGTQSRSTKGMRELMAYIHAGKIGKVNLAYGTCYKLRPSIGNAGLKGNAPPPPKTMDYDLWCGPARVLTPHRGGKHGPVHYDWHWIWEYGNGDFGNQGVHEADKARWGIQKSLPTSVVTVGGRFGYVDDGETPNTELALYDFGDAHMIFEVRGLPSKNPFPHGFGGEQRGGANFVGNIWWGTDGVVASASYSGGVAFDKDGKKVAEFKGGGDEGHFDNFVKAVRSHKMSDLNCPVEEGHYSAALCHLANLSYRLGSEATMDKADAAFGGDKDAKEALARMKDHLTDNKVDLKTAVGQVGVRLEFDPKAEKIVSAGGADLAKANSMLFREYRKGFDITEAV